MSNNTYVPTKAQPTDLGGTIEWLHRELDEIALSFFNSAARVDDPLNLVEPNTNILVASTNAELQAIGTLELPAQYLIHINFDFPGGGPGLYYYDATTDQYNMITPARGSQLFSLPVYRSADDVPTAPADGAIALCIGSWLDGGAATDPTRDGVFVYSTEYSWRRLDWTDPPDPPPEWDQVTVTANFTIRAPTSLTGPYNAYTYEGDTRVTGTISTDDSPRTWTAGDMFSVTNHGPRIILITGSGYEIDSLPGDTFTVDLFPEETGTWVAGTSGGAGQWTRTS